MRIFFEIYSCFKCPTDQNKSAFRESFLMQKIILIILNLLIGLQMNTHMLKKYLIERKRITGRP